MGDRLSEVKILFELEPVVKLFCVNEKCRFNLVNVPEAGHLACGLKYNVISKDGMCKSIEQVDGNIDRNNIQIDHERIASTPDP